MYTSVCVFVLLSVIQVIHSQAITPVPKECAELETVKEILRCCPLPFKQQELAACRKVKKTERINDYYDTVPNDEKGECPREYCLLNNRGILHLDGTIDYDELREHLNKWALDKPYLREGVNIAMDICLTNKSDDQDEITGMYIPICEPVRLFHCLTYNILWNCELIKVLPACKSLYGLRELCRPYLYKLPQNMEKAAKYIYTYNLF